MSPKTTDRRLASGGPVHRREARTLRALTFTLLLSLVALGACSGDDEQAYVEQPVEDLYNRAQDELQEGNNAEAAVAFEEVERQHPYSQWATRAQLMAAYAYY
jgi:outer membrane protein assembly factor BamD